MNNKEFTIREHGFIAAGAENKQCFDHIILKHNLFSDIENFIIRNKNDSNNELSEFLTISYKKGYGKILQAKNYVGVIQLKNNIIIEILPKIFVSENGENDSNQIEATRKIFLRMLKTLKDSPFKYFGSAHLKAIRLSLKEIFIYMFLEELSILIKRGLKSDYIAHETNSSYLKGKLKTEKHLTKNLFHKEKFYVEFDRFQKDRPENRLIKTTLMHLGRQSGNNNNRKNIKNYLSYFDDIHKSVNVDSDLSKCHINRLMTDYENIIRWCRVFLKNESFLNYKGETISFALLFPMEKIFESYIAYQIRKSGYFDMVQIQDSRYHLLTEETASDRTHNLCRLVPDIFAVKGDQIYIFDTKWKLLDSDTSKYGISESDLHQLFSYGKIYEDKYDCENLQLALIYPKTPTFANPVDLTYLNETGIPLRIVPVDLGKGNIELINDYIITP